MISNNDRAWTCINRWRRRGYDGQVEIFETVMAENERFRAALQEVCAPFDAEARTYEEAAQLLVREIDRRVKIADAALKEGR